MRTHTISLALATVLLCPISSAQWVKQESGTTRNLYGVYFTDVNTGTVVGDSGTILRTTDGGARWTSQSTVTKQRLTKIQYAGANLGWAVGDSGIIIHTTNGGASWASQNSGTASCLLGISFTDAMTGWVVSGQVFPPYHEGIILHTTNGGANWTSVYAGPANLRSVYFVNRETGFAVGDTLSAWGSVSHTDGIALRTTNGGMSWDRYIGGSLSNSQFTGLESTERSFFPVHNFYSCVQFTDNLTGWILSVTDIAVGMAGNSFGVILITTNAGVTWSANGSEVSNTDYTSSHLVNSSTGWVVGRRTGGLGSDTAAIWLTTDAGSTWNTQFLEPSSPRLGDIHFVDNTNGWAVGDNGTILHTTNGGVTWVEGEQRGIPQRFLLDQNYPNPFNPSTTIKFELLQSSVVRLSVFDMLGREVSVLVNERLDAGVHEMKFDGANLASGVYFYRLQAGDFTHTKRLLLLK
jgi:photosystem II stability/assembly factor-like uncharacterized protein